MRVPLRLNEAGTPKFAQHVRYCGADPRALLHPERLDREHFSRCISMFRSAGTFKTTSPHRHPRSNALLIGALPDKPLRVHDIGISDGVTTLELMECLHPQTEFYATDRILTVQAIRAGRWVAFFENDRCTLLATKHVIAYPNRPLRRLARRAKMTVSLVQPDLVRIAQEKHTVHLQTYDLFTPWRGPQLDVVRAANVLNRSYFSDSEIQLALRNMHRALLPGGILLLVENRPEEQATLFARRERGFAAVQSLPVPCDVMELVEQTQC